MKRDSRTATFAAEQTSRDAGNPGTTSDKAWTNVAERWLKENREALESSNDYVVRMGLPLARYRRF